MLELLRPPLRLCAARVGQPRLGGKAALGKPFAALRLCSRTTLQPQQTLFSNGGGGCAGLAQAPPVLPQSTLLGSMGAVGLSHHSHLSAGV